MRYNHYLVIKTFSQTNLKMSLSKQKHAFCRSADCSVCYDRSFASFDNQYKLSRWSKKNGDLRPRDLSKYSKVKCWFDCDKCDHSFESALFNVTGGTWCAYCVNQKRCKEECDWCYKNSFASHPKAIYWSKRNGEITPRDIAITSNEKYWFDCNECGHDFETLISNIIFTDQWCSYCGGHALCDNQECEWCLKESFASHPKAHCFLPDNKRAVVVGRKTRKIVVDGKTKVKKDPIYEYIPVTARDVKRGSRHKYKFKCDDCNHVFETSIDSIMVGETWCPYCANQKLCDDNNCKQCHNKSFASHDKSKYWSDENNMTPRQMAKFSNERATFDCEDCGNKFKSKICNVANGTWCPVCKNKTEKKLYKYLREQKHTVKQQMRFKWCINPETKKVLPFDFYLKDYFIIIELDAHNT